MKKKNIIFFYLFVILSILVTGALLMYFFGFGLFSIVPISPDYFNVRNFDNNGIAGTQNFELMDYKIVTTYQTGGSEIAATSTCNANTCGGIETKRDINNCAIYDTGRKPCDLTDYYCGRANDAANYLNSKISGHQNCKIEQCGNGLNCCSNYIYGGYYITSAQNYGTCGGSTYQVLDSATTGCWYKSEIYYKGKLIKTIPENGTTRKRFEQVAVNDKNEQLFVYNYGIGQNNGVCTDFKTFAKITYNFSKNYIISFEAPSTIVRGNDYQIKAKIKNDYKPIKGKFSIKPIVSTGFGNIEYAETKDIDIPLGDSEQIIIVTSNKFENIKSLQFETDIVLEFSSLELSTNPEMLFGTVYFSSKGYIPLYSIGETKTLTILDYPNQIIVEKNNTVFVEKNNTQIITIQKSFWQSLLDFFKSLKFW